MFGLEFIKEILPAPLPFGLDDKIFYSCREECEEGVNVLKNLTL